MVTLLVKTILFFVCFFFIIFDYPKKVNSLGLEKTLNFKGKLTGIKGQYLIFEDGTVFNVRSSEGYIVKFEV